MEKGWGNIYNGGLIIWPHNLIGLNCLRTGFMYVLMHVCRLGKKVVCVWFQCVCRNKNNSLPPQCIKQRLKHASLKYNFVSRTSMALKKEKAEVLAGGQTGGLAL